MPEPQTKAPSRALLLANHAFPGEYIVKAFGPSTPQFRDGVRLAATAVVGEDRADVSERASRHGAKVCITLRLNARTVEEVIEVYDRIYTVDDLAMIL